MSSPIIDTLTAHINFNEGKFRETLFYSFLCFMSWIVFPHLQFKYKLISRLFGNDLGRACDFLAYYLMYIGTIRNHVFNEAIDRNLHIEYGKFEIPLVTISFPMMAIGLVLIFGSFYRLKMRNMYFGDHFGFLFEEKITSFPYNYVDNPQYVGTTLFFLGYSVFKHSPAGMFISLVIFVLYKILNLVEDRKLAIFYPPKKTD